MMNCAASAASKTPSKRVITASAFDPSTRMMGPAATKASNVSTSTAPSALSTTIERSSPSFWLINSITDAIDPGPAIIGIAIGKTDTSSISGVSIIFCARSSRRSVRFSNTMSMAIKNSMTPPAMRKLFSSICSAPSNCSPNKAKTSKIPAAIKAARIAMLRRWASVASFVRLA